MSPPLCRSEPWPPSRTLSARSSSPRRHLLSLFVRSISTDQPARGVDNPPPALLDGTWREFAQSFYTLLRKPGNANPELTSPVPEAWDAVRKQWPVLASKTDEELLTALGPIAAYEVDFRNL